MVEAHPGSFQRRFIPKVEQVEALKKALASSEAIDEKHLNAEQATTTLDQYFTCTICLQVVEEPEEC